MMIFKWAIRSLKVDKVRTILIFITIIYNGHYIFYDGWVKGNR